MGRRQGRSQIISLTEGPNFNPVGRISILDKHNRSDLKNDYFDNFMENGLGGVKIPQKR